MGTRFIFDRELKKEHETLAEIFSLAKKKAYPTKDATHLAAFVNSCFYVFEEEARQEEALKVVEAQKRKWEYEEKIRKQKEKQKLEELETFVPLPEAPMPSDLELIAPVSSVERVAEMKKVEEEEEKKLRKREYVLRIYDSPIGILVDQDELGHYVYHVIEPVLKSTVVDKAKEMFGRDFENDDTLFDNKPFLVRVAEKVSKKTGVRFNDLLASKLKYYLERDILGAGIFDPFLYDDRVKEIVCDGINKSIKINYAGFGKIETNVLARKSEDINNFIHRIAESSGVIVDEDNPILNVTFQGLKFEGVMGVGGKTSTLTVRRLKQ